MRIELTIIIILVSSCTLLNRVINSVHYCTLLEIILDEDQIRSILGLNDADKIIPHVRVLDETGEFVKCTGFRRGKKENILVPYRVTSGIKPDVNTGHYRDLIIYNIKKKRDTLKVIMFASNYKTHHNKNSSYVILAKYKVDNRYSFRRISIKINEWHDDTPLPDYDKLSN